MMLLSMTDYIYTVGHKNVPLYFDL